MIREPAGVFCRALESSEGVTTYEEMVRVDMVEVKARWMGLEGSFLRRQVRGIVKAVDGVRGA